MKSQAIRLLVITGKTDTGSLLMNEMKSSGNIAYCSEVMDLSGARLKLKEQIFSLILTDYFLKDGTSTDLIPFMNGTPFIVMVDEGKEDTALTSLKTGACDYIVKDSRNEFVKILPIKINRALEQRMQSLELQKYRSELENIVEERTIELIDMYGKLQQSEINFRNIFNCSSDCIIITDYEINFMEANQTLLKEFGVNKEYLATHNLLDMIAPDYQPMVKERIKDMSSWLNIVWEIDLIAPVSQSIIPFEVYSVPIVFNNTNVILSVLHNLSERKNQERKLFETIILTEEEERTRIARDLHDEIGPLLSALKIYTNTFLESTSEIKKEKLAKLMGSIVRDVLEAIKVISNDMSPHILVNFGLAAAIQNFIDLFPKKMSIHFTSNLDKARFAATIESLIFRIIKELINNTLKHAQASEIILNIEYFNKAIHCRYFDNGTGFDWNQHIQHPSKGMGIHNIITRIKSLGGDFEIHTEPMKGFEINITLQTTPKDVIH